MSLGNVVVSIPLALTLLAAACAKQVVHRPVPSDFSSQSVVSQSDDLHVLAGEWEYVDEAGAVDRLTLDGEGSGHYNWKEGRFETRTLIGHIWQGKWIQKENDRDGGFTVEFTQDFTEGEGRWWYSRIGSDHAPTQKGGTFRIRKKAARLNNSRTSGTVRSLSPHSR